jgi:segregation and condensation protein B
MEDLKNKIEALLFATGKSVSEEDIKKICRITNDEDLKKALEDLKIDYDHRDSSLKLVNEGNRWKIVTKENYFNVIKKVVTETELSKSLMETLAVIAWKYPIKQCDIIKVRTNKAYAHLDELENLGYISRQKHGRTKLIKLTDKFFAYFDLPPEKLKEKFNDFNQIAQAISQKEHEIKQMKEGHKQQVEEIKQMQEQEEQKQKEEILKQQNEIDLIDQQGKSVKLEQYDSEIKDADKTGNLEVYNSEEKDSTKLKDEPKEDKTSSEELDDEKEPEASEKDNKSEEDKDLDNKKEDQSEEGSDSENDEEDQQETDNESENKEEPVQQEQKKEKTTNILDDFLNEEESNN